jgi:manganese oxidase
MRSPRLTDAAAGVALVLFPLAPRAHEVAHPAPDTRIVSNDNRHPAGTLRSGVLTVRIDARDGTWTPDGLTGHHYSVAAFAEAGRTATTPGPLLRVPLGTEVRATVRNTLGKTLWMYGLGTKRGVASDSVAIAPGASHEFRFRPDAPGLFYYAGRTVAPNLVARSLDDSQLQGVLVVDSAGAPPDRIFVISNWFVFPDTTRVSSVGAHVQLQFNGHAWPNTERLDLVQNDTVHWRFLNLSALEHPLHLHGFYYRVDSRGDGARDSTFAPADRRLTVTELMIPGQTMSMTWAPTRSGNWIFHCHLASHIATEEALESDRVMPKPGMMRHEDMPGHDPLKHMSGLVLGIRVASRGEVRQASMTPARPIRLVVKSRASVYGPYAGYSFVLGGSPAEAVADSMPVPGPVLSLVRDEPVAVTIVNRSHDKAAIHWHGIELESFPDGVPNWSGAGRTTLPLVAPQDSLTVRFTPPRAGTFIYHSHANEMQQISSGLYGALIVTEPGQPRDEERDKIVLFSDDGPWLNFIKPPPPTRVNGRVDAAPLQLKAGMPTRVRLINIHSDYILDLTLLDGETTAQWRVLAKDGADLAPNQTTLQPAVLQMSVGQTYDVEVTARVGTTLRLKHKKYGFPEKAAPTQYLAVEVK